MLAIAVAVRVKTVRESVLISELAVTVTLDVESVEIAVMTSMPLAQWVSIRMKWPS